MAYLEKHGSALSTPGASPPHWALGSRMSTWTITPRKICLLMLAIGVCYSVNAFLLVSRPHQVSLCEMVPLPDGKVTKSSATASAPVTPHGETLIQLDAASKCSFPTPGGIASPLPRHGRHICELQVPQHLQHLFVRLTFAFCSTLPRSRVHAYGDGVRGSNWSRCSLHAARM